jgi:hypothetical protein
MPRSTVLVALDHRADGAVMMDQLDRICGRLGESGYEIAAVRFGSWGASRRRNLFVVGAPEQTGGHAVFRSAGKQAVTSRHPQTGKRPMTWS